jgi:Transposase DDE domain
MSPQFSENLLLQIYVEVDDLLKAFENWSKEKALGKPYRPTRTPGLSPSEIATIVIAYHFSGYKCFEYYYKECLLQSYLPCFPKAPSYQRFVPYIQSVLPLLFLLLMLKTSQSIPTGYYFIDSKKIEVCHIRREKDHKVFKDFASKGKSSTGWFYGLKLHLVINHLGQIVAFRITPAATADNNQAVLGDLLTGLKGKCGGDKGYLTTLFEHFYNQGLHLVVRPKKKMKPLPVYASDVHFLKQRAVIESVNDILVTVCNVEHSRHRNPLHGMANILAALIAYQYLPTKPHVFIPNAINYLQAA